MADGDALTRQVIRQELLEDGGFVVVAETSDGAQTVAACRSERPDLLLIETQLGRSDGIAVVRTRSSSGLSIGVVMFAVHAGVDVQMQALLAGACGFVLKDRGVGQALDALRIVAGGEAAVGPLLTAQLLQRWQRTPVARTGLRPVRSNLTSREWEVLALLVDEATTRDIADELFLTLDTVYSHVKSILRKLDVRSRSEAVAVARRLSGPGQLAPT